MAYINLDGAETSIIKALGFSGTEISGKTLMESLGKLGADAVISTINGLISVGFVSCDRVSIQSLEDFERGHFQINSGYARDLKEALEPTQTPTKSKRVRRE